MTIALPPELETWVENCVKSGLYSSSAEVVQEALRMMVRLEQAQTARLQELRALIDMGLESADAGRTSVVDDALIAEVKRFGRTRSRA
jgi:putative addiction module CopG family antidote